MAKKASKLRPWTKEDIRTLKTLAREKTKTTVIARKLSAALLAVPGASAYFIGGAVIYTAAARRALLGISDQAMTGMRASTEAYAGRLAGRSALAAIRDALAAAAPERTAA
jgi:nicotinamide mononucleotide (NMN) deamidase PncC